MNQPMPRFSNKPQPEKPAKAVTQSFSDYCTVPDANGIIWRHLFMLSGAVTNLVLEVEHWTGNGKLYVVRSNGTEYSETVILNAKAGRFEGPDTVVKQGDKFMLKYEPEKEGVNSVSDIWIAFAFKAGAKE